MALLVPCTQHVDSGRVGLSATVPANAHEHAAHGISGLGAGAHHGAARCGAEALQAAPRARAEADALDLDGRLAHVPVAVEVQARRVLEAVLQILEQFPRLEQLARRRRQQQRRQRRDALGLQQSLGVCEVHLERRSEMLDELRPVRAHARAHEAQPGQPRELGHAREDRDDERGEQQLAHAQRRGGEAVAYLAQQLGPQLAQRVDDRGHLPAREVLVALDHHA